MSAIQTFEHGWMFWNSKTREIWALDDNGQADRFPEPVYGHFPANPIQDTPPPNRQRPVNGFGKVWGNRPAIRVALGWALLAERSVSVSVRDEDGITYLTIPGQAETRINANDGTWIKDDAPPVIVSPPVDPDDTPEIPDDVKYITVAEHKIALEALRVQMLQMMDARLTAHIERSLNIDEVMAHMISLLRAEPKPIASATSATLLKQPKAG